MRRSLLESFNCAVEGLIHCFRTQRNMKIHMLAAGLIVGASALFSQHLTVGELFGLWSAVAIVLVCEMLNTVIEEMINFINRAHNPQVKVMKDMAAGAVLLASLYAFGVGYVIFFRRMSKGFENALQALQELSLWHIALWLLVLIVVLAIGIKVLVGRGKPLQGGMPSLHSALAFGIWASTLFLTQGLDATKAAVLTVLVLILSLFVAISRVASRVHTVSEVIAGGILGVAVAIFIFKIMPWY